MATSYLHNLNGDLLENIMARVDGLGLASLSSTCSDLRATIAEDNSLWKRLCNFTWPSTLNSSLICRFDQFFADSYPLIFYDEADTNHTPPKLHTSTAPSDFVSLVDVYYKNQCVLSRVVHGIPEATDALIQSKLMDSNWDIVSAERWEWFLNCPFKMQLLELTYDEDEHHSRCTHIGNIHTNNDGRSQYNCKELAQNLRLSWVLLDKKAGKAVNLSSWKPFSIQSLWPYNGEYVMQFGSVIPVEETLLPNKLARCTITTRFKLTERHGCLQWREISMTNENVTGALVNGRKSLAILNRALYSSQTINRHRVENGLNQYEKQKKKIIRRQELKEKLAEEWYKKFLQHYIPPQGELLEPTG